MSVPLQLEMGGEVLDIQSSYHVQDVSSVHSITSTCLDREGFTEYKVRSSSVAGVRNIPALPDNRDGPMRHVYCTPPIYPRGRRHLQCGGGRGHHSSIRRGEFVPIDD